MRNVKHSRRQLFSSGSHLDAGICSGVVQRKFASVGQEAACNVPVRRNREFGRGSIHQHRICRGSNVNLRFLCFGRRRIHRSLFSTPARKEQQYGKSNPHASGAGRKKPARSLTIPAQGIMDLKSEKKQKVIFRNLTIPAQYLTSQPSERTKFLPLPEPSDSKRPSTV